LWMAGRGGGAAGGTSTNFLRRPTWKTSCSRVHGGRARHTVTALMSSVTPYGLKKRGLSFPLVAWGRRRQHDDGGGVGPNRHCIGDRAVQLVVVPVLDHLGLFQPVADVRQELVAVRHVLGDSGHRVSLGS
jgi:hypothetical protein